jgi:hypothetical protein
MVIVTTYYLPSIKAIEWMLSEVWIFKEVAQLQVGFKPQWNSWLKGVKVVPLNFLNVSNLIDEPYDLWRGLYERGQVHHTIVASYMQNQPH